jgi:hypothetical protein
VEPRWDEEILDTGGRRQVRVRTLVAVIVVLAVGIGLGFLAGRNNNRSASPAPPTRTKTVTATLLPPVTATVPEVFQDVDTTGRRCSAIVSGRLQLGIQVANHSNTSLQLFELTPVLPLGGLRLTATAVGSCGQLPPSATVRGYRFAADSTVWLTATFDVRVRCPSFVPVSFLMRYQRAGNTREESLNGFGDLGDVPYPCPPSSSQSR